MRKSRIEKVISRKVNKWLDSIEDDKLRSDLKDNIIVTGGCIVSLLNNEIPNDFDVYFRTKFIAKRVAQYYCDIFNENIKNKKKLTNIGKNVHAWVLDGEDVSKYINKEIKIEDFAYGYEPNSKPSGMLISTLPERIKVIINSDGVANDGTVEDPEEKNINMYLETVTPSEKDDVELIDEALDTSVESYLESVEDADEISEDILNEQDLEKKPYRPVFLSTNAITLSDKIQLVFRFYGEPEKIHDTFDYIHCMCYWTSWKNEVVYTVEALDSIINKELKYVGSKYPICSVLRMRKFLSRGWTINAGQILKMAFQISELDLQDINVLEDQLVGVDSLYFMNAIKHLRKIAEEKAIKGETFTYDSTYLATIIDKIFN